MKKSKKLIRRVLSGEDASMTPVKILAVESSRCQVRLQVVLSGRFAARLNNFLREKGFFAFGRQSDGIALLVEYGLSAHDHACDGNDLEWLMVAGPEYASMRFKTHEYYAKNFLIAMGLRLHLEENRMLKQALRERGLGNLISEDEWDSWDESRVMELYRRYVFTR